MKFIMKALQEEEDNDPMIQNRIKEMVRASPKSDSLKPLHKIISNMNDLEEILNTIINYCSNQNNLMVNLKERLMKMKTPRTKMNQYTNSKLIVELIELLQDKKMIQVTSNPLYVLMVEKSLMVSHLP